MTNSIAKESWVTVEPIPRLMLAFMVPVLIGSVLQTCNGLVSALWVGNSLGSSALGAIGNIGALMVVLTGLLSGIGASASVMVGQAIGAGEQGRARQVIANGAIVYVGVSIALSVLGVVGARHVLGWMNTPAEVLPYAIQYLRWAFLGVPFACLSGFLLVVLRSAGDTRTPLKFLVLAIGLDAALHPLFMFGWGWIAPLGIAGSAIAGLVSEAIAAIGIIVYMYRVSHPMRLSRGELATFRIQPGLIRSIVRQGWPMSAQTLVASLSMVLMFGLVNSFGAKTTAAYSACFQLWAYVQIPIFALHGVVLAVASQNIGASRWDRIGTIARTGFFIHLALTGGLIILTFVLGKELFSLLLADDSEAIAIALHINMIAVWLHLFLGIFHVLCGIVRAAGAFIPALVIQIMSAWGVRVSFAYFFVNSWGADAIWMSFPLGAIASMSLMLAFYHFGDWRSGNQASLGWRSAVPTPK